MVRSTEEAGLIYITKNSETHTVNNYINKKLIFKLIFINYKMLKNIINKRNNKK